MERAVIVYTTWPTAVEAEAAGRIWWSAGLPPASTSCRHDLDLLLGRRVERGEEAVMIIKTRAALADDVTRAVKELHSYKTPAILVMRWRAWRHRISAGCWTARARNRKTRKSPEKTLRICGGAVDAPPGDPRCGRAVKRASVRCAPLGEPANSNQRSLT